MANGTPSGYFYNALSDSELPHSGMTAQELRAAEGRPEHPQVVALLNRELVITNRRGKDNRFGIKRVELFPLEKGTSTISGKFQGPFEEKEREENQWFVLSTRGNALVNIVLDVRGSVACIKELEPREVTPNQGNSKSPSSRIKRIRRIQKGAKIVEAFDGTNAFDAENPLHLIPRQTLTQVRYCITLD